MLIDKSRCRVNLTCKASEMKNDDNQSHDTDPYYCQENITLPSQLEAVHKKELGNKHFMPRMISHPHFQNLTADQAKEFLADKDVGEYIFHPSSRGPCYLTLSLKIFGGLYVHKDIVEGGKNHDIKSLLGLGKTLKIGEEIFEGIDKVNILNSDFSYISKLFFPMFFVYSSLFGFNLTLQARNIKFIFTMSCTLNFLVLENLSLTSAAMCLS